jgi:hypothetical protein
MIGAAPRRTRRRFARALLAAGILLLVGTRSSVADTLNGFTS